MTSKRTDDGTEIIPTTLDDETYNGWANYETWVANLWLTNDEMTYRTARELAYAVKNGTAVRAEDHFVTFVEEIAFGASFDGPPASLGTDPLHHSLQRIDYVSIVEGLTEE